ncbi:(deoxy)nucleoside triphosphate pyrophosphohydrolase [Pseudonocardia sp. GCM10023141]|uniref:(deoxy)nucleoside triphosphate pyrophosphohydrolase n=1 Tax=Pseudonocardia sp. GCM10023141 TaxID=3252653 RepID=UPI00361EB7CE
MPVLRSTVLIDAEPRTVAGLLRDVATCTAAFERAGHRCEADSRLLSPGDELRVRVAVLPGLRIAVSLVVRSISDAGMVAVSAGGHTRAALTTTLTATGAGTLLMDELRWVSPLGPPGDVVLVRRLVLRLLAARSAVLVEQAAALAARPVVVATALVRDGRVLAAQRTRPPELAGRWELPGGRVESGESEPDAVVRECTEELGTTVRVIGRLGTDLPIDAGVLRVHVAEPAPGAPEPQALEHSALRWVAPAELAHVEWVAADRAVLPELGALLRQP